MEKYDDTVAVIGNMASVKLAMNSHKGRIEDMDEESIIRCLRQEIDELEASDSLINSIEEASDVYNFLMALVHKKITQYRKRKS